MPIGDPFCQCGCGGWLGQCRRPEPHIGARPVQCLGCVNNNELRAQLTTAESQLQAERERSAALEQDRDRLLASPTRLSAIIRRQRRALRQLQRAYDAHRWQSQEALRVERERAERAGNEAAVFANRCATLRGQLAELQGELTEERDERVRARNAEQSMRRQLAELQGELDRVRALADQLWNAGDEVDALYAGKIRAVLGDLAPSAPAEEPIDWSKVDPRREARAAEQSAPGVTAGVECPERVATGCCHRELLETDEDDPTGPECGKPVTNYNCNVWWSPRAKNVCAEHKCRCAQPDTGRADAGKP